MQWPNIANHYYEEIYRKIKVVLRTFNTAIFWCAPYLNPPKESAGVQPASKFSRQNWSTSKTSPFLRFFVVTERSELNRSKRLSVMQACFWWGKRGLRLNNIFCWSVARRVSTEIWTALNLRVYVLFLSRVWRFL